MDLDDHLMNLAKDRGADFFGLADLSPARQAILAQGGALVAGYPGAISVGISLPHAIVDQLPQRQERAVALIYRHHCYNVVNQRLDMLTSRLGGVLQAEGYRALPIPASQRVDDEGICAVFSHKLAAHLAGLGWIGKSCLLITPSMGPRVRWGSILTDAPLKIKGEQLAEGCGDCLECVSICPVGAFTGEPFRADEPREARYKASKCDRYLDRMEEKAGVAVCGMCLYVCPFGREEPRKNDR